MIVQNHTITVVRGDTWNDLRVRWLDSAGVAVVIASARLQVRANVDSETPIVSLSSPSGGITIDGSNHILPVLTAAQTAALSTGGVYDLEATSASGDVVTLLRGPFRLVKDVSR